MFRTDAGFVRDKANQAFVLGTKACYSIILGQFQETGASFPSRAALRQFEAALFLWR